MEAPSFCCFDGGAFGRKNAAYSCMVKVPMRAFENSAWRCSSSSRASRGRCRRRDTATSVSYTHLDVYKRQLVVCPSKHLVEVGGKPVSLSLKEFELLCALLQERGTVLTRAQLLDRIWGYEFDGETRTVDVHIRTLRQKLGPCGDLIETVRGVGYKIGEDRP